METGSKRRANGEAGDRGGKKQKTKKQWKVPRKQYHDDKSNRANAPRVISPGDSGIWATCNKGRERACIGELRDLFNEYAEMLYESGTDAAAVDASEGADANGGARATADESLSVGIENEIDAEVAEMRHPATAQLFTPIRVDVQCVVFFKTIAPVEPVSFVKRICQDALDRAHHKRTRYAKRLSPMTLIDRASAEGLERVAKAVLEPHFHRTPIVGRKFAIRPTLRNHNTITRDRAIQLVAQCVGKGHEVDLKNYDLLVVVEIFQNICGVSVLDNDFEKLRRFNLAEIYDPTPGRGEVIGEVKAETLASGSKPDHDGARERIAGAAAAADAPPSPTI